MKVGCLLRQQQGLHCPLVVRWLVVNQQGMGFPLCRCSPPLAWNVDREGLV